LLDFRILDVRTFKSLVRLRKREHRPVLRFGRCGGEDYQPE
jgi:hypothetical protein